MAHKSDAEIEENRQQALADLEADASAKFAPGTMGCHEALHTAWILLDTLDRHLLEHPAIVLNPAWYKRVARAHDELFEVYQDIGGADPPGSVLRFPQRK